jgi:hypothetical protein
MLNETELQTRLRLEKEALAQYVEEEAEARRRLAAAVENTRRVRERCDELFLAEERAEVARQRRLRDHP